jgi:hypothetical protein
MHLTVKELAKIKSVDILYVLGGVFLIVQKILTLTYA